MPVTDFNIKGLTDEQVLAARVKHGDNKIVYKKQSKLIDAALSLLKEPMVILLLVTSAIYFISGKPSDGIFLAFAIILVSAISLYQDERSRDALEKLQKYTQPNCKVIRNGKVEEIKTEDLVVGDSLMVEEGTSVSADGVIVHSNDFSVDESVLTGESLPVFKDSTGKENLIFCGTTVASGLAVAAVTAIGYETQLAKIGKSLEDIKEEKTPLEVQINNFVKKMVIVGVAVFAFVWILNYMRSGSVTESLLKALTLAMSILPEEIPVAFTTFMAIGAFRLMKMGVVVKHMKTLETLGSATVICTDKTGTITENKMALSKVFLLRTNEIVDASKIGDDDAKQLIRVSMWASEPIPFDPMEVALHGAYAKTAANDERPGYKMVHEYPLGGRPPMMTHIFEDNSGQRIIAAKGAPEALIAVSGLTPEQKQRVEEAIAKLSSQGYRVLGVGEADFTGNNFPPEQQEFRFHFKGLVAFYDPPKENIGAVMQRFYNAGIVVKIITGDNAATTNTIARQIGFDGYERSLSGEELVRLGDRELQEKAMKTNVFTRMFPDAKIKIINALKAQRQIVAMTGDGVNDGPALKAAHIGIAMGKRGTEIAKGAATLILLEDDLSKMVDAVAMGRRIYTNLKKAVRYIISIHVTIILTVFIPLTLGWVYPNIFSPIHIIFFELIMGPTCSIIYENEPIEPNSMTQPPRHYTTAFFNWKELTSSIFQGLVITAGTLFAYQYSVGHAFGEQVTRAIVFTVLITANVFLTLVNRSFYYSVFTTLRYKNNLVPLIICIAILISTVFLYVKPVSKFFGFDALSVSQLLTGIIIGFISVIWIEVLKWHRRKRQ